MTTPAAAGGLHGQGLRRATRRGDPPPALQHRSPAVRGRQPHARRCCTRLDRPRATGGGPSRNAHRSGRRLVPARRGGAGRQHALWVHQHRRAGPRAGRFGYCVTIGREFQRRGYAARRCRCWSGYMFGERRHQKCEVGIYAFNIRSLALHRGLGLSRSASFGGLSSSPATTTTWC